MAREPVKRQKSMFVKAETDRFAGQEPDMGIGGGNSTEATSISPALQGISGSPGLSTANFEEEKSKPRDSEHFSVGSTPEVLDRHQGGTAISVGSTLTLGRTGNAGRGEVLDRHSLKEALQVLGLTLKEFSVLADTPLDTVKGWSSGKTKTPGIALAMVRLLAQMR